MRSHFFSGSQSRLELEFDVIEVLGKGGFGDVRKVMTYDYTYMYLAVLAIQYYIVYIIFYMFRCVIVWTIDYML